MNITLHVLWLDTEKTFDAQYGSPLSTVDHNTTVGVQALGTDHATIWAGQKDKAGGNLGWLCGASQWRCELLLCLFGHC
jgi:hypothetical protein